MRQQNHREELGIHSISVRYRREQKYHGFAVIRYDIFLSTAESLEIRSVLLG